jgi:Flp pilus assembly protein TadG
MIETALVLTTFISLLIFGLDMGRMLLLQQYFTERAREGARYAVVNNWNAAAVVNFVCYGTTTQADTRTAGYLGLLPSQVAVTSTADSGANDGRIQVTISGVQMFAWIPFMSRTYTAAPVVATAPLQSRGAAN